MKKILIAFCCFCVSALSLFGEELNFKWEESLKLQKTMPKDAIVLFDEMVATFKQEQAWDQYVLAILLRASTKANIQGVDGCYVYIEDLKSEIDNSPSEEVTAFLNFFLANAYQFAYQIKASGNIEVESGDEGLNPKEWSREKTLSEALETYAQVFKNEKLLKQIPLNAFLAKKVKISHISENLSKDYVGLIILNDDSLVIYPTLYDFLKMKSIESLRNVRANLWADKKGLLFSELDFESRDLFNNIDMFLSYSISSKKYSPILVQIFKSYQDLLKFHKNDPNKSAFLKFDLERVVWLFRNVKNKVEQAEYYKKYLESFIEDNRYYPVVLEAACLLSDRLREEEDLIAAHNILKTALKYQGNSKDAYIGNVQDRINQIELSHLNHINVRRTWASANDAVLKLGVKNIDKLYVKLVKSDWKTFLNIDKNRPGSLSEKEKQFYFNKSNADWESSKVIESPCDFKLHDVSLSVDFDKLTPGFYFVVVSDTKDFQKSRYVYTTIWKTSLAVVSQSWEEGFVVDAMTGEPKKDVVVEAWNRRRDGSRVSVGSVKTDELGKFFIKGADSTAVCLATDVNGESVDFEGVYVANRRDIDIPPQTKMFLDRKIYRPGQIVYFKGIYYKTTRKGGEESVLPGKKIDVYLKDKNDKVVETKVCYTNEFGSFNGSFSLPDSIPLGGCKIQYLEKSISFNVEEYKRPKYEMSAKVLNKDIILGQRASVLLSAKSYTGAVLNGAKVEWSISRRSMSRYDLMSESKLIQGSGKLDLSGNLKIEFDTEKFPLTKEMLILPAEERIYAENNAELNYELNVKLVDSSGETHEDNFNFSISGCSVNVNILAKQSAFLISDKPAFEISASDLNGAKATAMTMFVYKRAKEGDNVSAQWLKGEKVLEKQFVVDKTGMRIFSIDTLPAGEYIAEISGKDVFSKAFRADTNFVVIDPKSDKYIGESGSILVCENKKWMLGETFTAYWGSGFDSAFACVLISNGKTQKYFWTEKGKTQQKIEFPITDDYSGGIYISVFVIKNNKYYENTLFKSVSRPDKELKISWQRFRTNLIPGAAEVWIATIKNPDGSPAKAEMVATMYDRSLDLFSKNIWPSEFFYYSSSFYDMPNRSPSLKDAISGNAWYSLPSKYFRGYVGAEWAYKNRFIRPLISSRRMYSMGAKSVQENESLMSDSLDTSVASAPVSSTATFNSAFAGEVNLIENTPGGSKKASKLDLSNVSVRKNLKETAFFYPQLLTDAEGNVMIQFVVPEALTSWRFLGFAHDKNLRFAEIENDAIITSKDLMVQANAPRFVRAGDSILFPVKISNAANKLLKGKARIEFKDLKTGKDVTSKICKESAEKSFSIDSSLSKTIEWQVVFPENCEYLTYRVLANTESGVSDGEEAILPVLSRKITLTESAFEMVTPGSEKVVLLKNLLSSKKSSSLVSRNLTIDIVADPTWFAIKALPSYQTSLKNKESTDSIFNRFYANAMSTYILKNSDLKSVLDSWKISGGLVSPFYKNKEIANVVLEDSPYLLLAESETQMRQNLIRYFDENELKSAMDLMNTELTKRLNEFNGNGWSWFEGGRDVSISISREILIGCGRLLENGFYDINLSLKNAIKYQDRWLKRIFDEAKKEKEQKIIVTEDVAEYLYMRTFFMKGSKREVPFDNSEIWDAYIAEIKKDEAWSVCSKTGQAYLALTLLKIGDVENAKKIANSLKQYAIESNSIGMYWKDSVYLPYRYSAPIERQALMIELFDKIGDARSVENLKTWLITQKQTSVWNTSSATVNAIYALVYKNEKFNLKKANVENVSLYVDGELQKPISNETGTGCFSIVLPNGKITSGMGNIKLSNKGETQAWLSAYWTYSESLEKIDAHNPKNGFAIEKTIWKKIVDVDGKEKLRASADEMFEPGDTLIVRIKLITDRDFEFVYLRDMRASGFELKFEPSGYKYEKGYSYYQSNRDTHTNFYFDSLRAGTYIFEYPVYVQQRGKYISGIAEVRSMYAPEFNAHSDAKEISAF